MTPFGQKRKFIYWAPVTLKPTEGRYATHCRPLQPGATRCVI